MFFKKVNSTVYKCIFVTSFFSFVIFPFGFLFLGSGHLLDFFFFKLHLQTFFFLLSFKMHVVLFIFSFSFFGSWRTSVCMQSAKIKARKKKKKKNKGKIIERKYWTYIKSNLLVRRLFNFLFLDSMALCLSLAARYLMPVLIPFAHTNHRQKKFFILSLEPKMWRPFWLKQKA